MVSGVLLEANLWLTRAPDDDHDPPSDVEAHDALQRQASDDSENDQEDEARSHARHNYVEVGPSSMRRQANFIEAASENQMKRYAGVKTTRREMMDSDEGGDYDEEEVGHSGEDKDSEMAEDDEDEDEGEGEEKGAEENGEEEDADQGDAAARTSGTTRVRFEAPSEQPNHTASLNAAQSDAQLLQDLRKRSKEDAEKGRDTRKQMDNWGKLLGIRIRGQKVVRAAGRVPAKMIRKHVSELGEADRDAYESTLASLDDISSHLFSLQRQVLQSFTGNDSKESSIVSPALANMDDELKRVSQRAKRPHSALQDEHSDIDTLLKLDRTIFEPLWRDVLVRWTSRTSVSVEGAQKKKFESSLKAMNLSAEDQVDRGLASDAFDRLRKRTRVWRGTEREARIGMEAIAADQTDSDDEQDMTQEQQTDIFDDSDFYAAMLRELIDSRGASSEATGHDGSDSSMAWAQAAKRASKKNRGAEARASKGRKLRFDVNEKVQNFMPPIPRETWSKEQIERLFRQLSGVAERQPEVVAEDEQAGLDGLRLFG